MKTLTVTAFVFLPLTFIGQLFGMSFQYLPLTHHPYGFWMILGAMAAIATLIFLYFKYRKWL